MKHLSKRSLLLLSVLIGAVAVAVSALGASAARADRLYIGTSLHLTGPDTAAGTFVMSGALEDAGTSQVERLSLLPIGSTNMARLSGDQTFVGAKGTIVTHFEGKAFPLSSPHSVGQGRVEIVSGTGAYAGLRGNAKFLIVVDAGSNQLIGTLEGRVRGV